MRTLGKALSYWIFFLVVCIPIAGAYVTLSGLCPMEAIAEVALSQMGSTGLGAQ